MELFKIDCGKTSIDIKVFDSGPLVLPGPTVVITAGMDGDEYVGIETAQRLVRIFSHTKPLNGRIVIIPLVNKPGFDAKTSLNPHDNKFPKHVYPGSQKGTETERLIAWISSRYLGDADYWIDLHGGATNESLTPFVWGYQTKNIAVNERTEHILRAIHVPITVYQKNFSWKKVEKLAEIGCSYLICECGERGIVREDEVGRLNSWVMKMLGALGLVVHGSETKKITPWYEEVHEYKQSKDNWVWNSCVTAGEDVQKGQVLGEARNPKNSDTALIRSSQDGIVLWHILSGVVSKQDTLIALAR